MNEEKQISSASKNEIDWNNLIHSAFAVYLIYIEVKQNKIRVRGMASRKSK